MDGNHVVAYVTSPDQVLTVGCQAGDTLLEKEYCLSGVTLEVRPRVHISDVEIDITLTGQPVTYQLTATTHPAGQPITWTTTDPEIANVDQTGLVTAYSDGYCVVSASMEYEGETYAGQCDVFVTSGATPGVTLNPHELWMEPNTTNNIDFTTVPADEIVTVSSSDDSVVGATAYYSRGYIELEALSEGTATVTVSMTYDGQTYTDSALITVSQPGIQFDVDNLTLDINLTVLNEAITVPGGIPVTYTSDDDTIAGIGSDGTVMGISPGQTTVRASMTYGGQTYSAACDVTVNGPSVSFDTDTLSLTVGETAVNEAITNPYGQPVTYSSDDDTVASIDASGNVTAIGSGSTTLTATMTYDGQTYTDTCSVTVAAPQPGVHFDTNSLSLTVGGSYWNEAITVPAGQPVTYTSDDDTVATIESNGSVTGVGPGTTTVRVSMEYDGQTYTDTCSVGVTADI